MQNQNLCRKIIVLMLMIALLQMHINNVVANQVDVKTVTSYKVDKMIVKGNDRVPDTSVLHYLNMHQGRSYTLEQINEMIRNAYDTGFFKKITIDYSRENHEIIINVAENAIVNSTELYGNRKINDKDIKAILKLNPGLTFSETRLKKDIENLLLLYQKRGLFNAMINPKIIDNKNGTLTIAYEIKEGSKAVIEKISFVGNTAFLAADLKQVMLSNEWSWYRFFSSSYLYDQEKLQVDAEMLKEYYQTNGYPNVKVIDTIAEIDAAKKAFVLTFVIDEGEKCNLGEIKIENKVKSVSDEKITKAIEKIKFRNTLFDINKVREVIEIISTKFTSDGYAFVDIKHELKVKDGTVDVILKIKESQKFFINKINIFNNSKTYDSVIRRQIRIGEGDSYDMKKIERSLQRVKNLGYFDDVAITPKQVNDTDKVDLDFNVKEKNTAFGLVNVGYNTVSGPFLGFSVSESNLMGKGRMISTAVQIAKRDKGVDFSISEPYFMGFDATSGFNMFFDKRTYKQFASAANKDKHGDEKLELSQYATISWGGTIHTMYRITEYLQHGIHYGLKLDRLNKNNASTLMESLSQFLRPEMKTHTTSSIGHSLIYDRTDSTVKATKGYILKLHQEFAGIGGDAKYMQNEVTATNYTPVYKDQVILKVQARAGIATALGGKNLRILDNFFSRDDLIRGFAYNGIGARDARTFDSLGGKQYMAGSAELKFPIGFPNELDISGLAFLDAASLRKIDVPQKLKNVRYYDSGDIRSSYGVGVIWTGSPLGIIRVSYGIPIKKKAFDQVDRINFGFGKSF